MGVGRLAILENDHLKKKRLRMPGQSLEWCSSKIVQTAGHEMIGKEIGANNGISTKLLHEWYQCMVNYQFNGISRVTILVDLIPIIYLYNVIIVAI